MLFPEKMIDFVRTTGPIFLFAVKALHGEIFNQDGQNKKQKKKKKNKKKQKNIKIKFELQTFNLHQIIQRELMIGFFYKPKHLLHFLNM